VAQVPTQLTEFRAVIGKTDFKLRRAFAGTPADCAPANELAMGMIMSMIKSVNNSGFIAKRSDPNLHAIETDGKGQY
jgi:hypothetical protein